MHLLSQAQDLTEGVQLLDRRYGERLDHQGRELLGHAPEGATRMQALIDVLLEHARVGTAPDPRGRVEEAPGGGSSVEFVLGDGDDGRDEARARGDTARGGHPRDVCLMADGLSSGDGAAHRLYVVHDREAALAFLRKGDPRIDLVLLDLDLPRKSGLEVLAELKGDDALRRPPVIVLLGSDAEPDVARATTPTSTAAREGPWTSTR